MYIFQSQEDLWLSSAQKLTNIIKQIIEFAKMVPGFMKFAQDDQIALLKRGKNTIIVRILIIFDMRIMSSKFVFNWLHNYLNDIIFSSGLRNRSYSDEQILRFITKCCTVPRHYVTNGSLFNNWRYFRDETGYSNIWIC